VFSAANSLRNFNCGAQTGASDSNSNNALISNIFDDGFSVEENGRNIRLIVGQCTRLGANSQGYHPKVGDRIRWRGGLTQQQNSEANYSQTVNTAAVACYA
jgi:hypothetical protein